MKNPLRVTITFLSIHAALIAIQHGIFAMLQGNTVHDSLIMFNAIGPPCQPEAVWHACFPAMTLIPNLLVSGTAAVVIGISLILWSLFFVKLNHSGWVSGILSLMLLLVGGGFVPVFIGLVAAIASRSLDSLPLRSHLPFLAVFWPWPLVIMAAWLPGSWLLGYFFGPFMLSVSGLLFLVFDIALPVLGAVSGAQNNYMKEKYNG